MPIKKGVVLDADLDEILSEYLQSPIAQSDVSNLETDLGNKLDTEDFNAFLLQWNAFLAALDAKPSVKDFVDYHEAETPPSEGVSDGETCITNDGKLYTYSDSSWNAGVSMSTGDRYWHNEDPWNILEWNGSDIVVEATTFGTLAAVESEGAFYWNDGTGLFVSASSPFSADIEAALNAAEDGAHPPNAENAFATIDDLPDTSTMLKSDASVAGAQTLNAPQVFQNHIQVGYADPALAITSLLHLDNNYTDLGGLTWTANTQVMFHTEKKFGTHSLLFLSPSNGTLSCTDNNLVINNQPFTFDFWMKGAGTTNYIFYINSAISSILLQFVSNTSIKLVYQNVNRIIGTVSGTWTTWHHYAIVGNSSNIKFFIDGVLQGTYDVAYSIGYNKFQFGDPGNNNGLIAYVDEIRFVNGTAKWTGDFTPPTSAYSTAFVEGKVLFHSPDNSSTVELTYSDVVALKALLE